MSLTDLRRRVDDALVRELDVALPRIEALHGSLPPLTTALRELVAGGGKRLRPVALLIGYRGAGHDDVAPALGPALALELVHTCALLHDDVIDRAPTRRGAATVHRRFAAAHRESGWAGDPDRIGEAVAILLGDLAFALADGCFLRAAVPAERLLAGMARFTLLREEVMAGQALDVLAQAQRASSPELALTVASLKSGRYSVSRPLEIGAILGGASDAVVAALGSVGERLGQAFQLRDDVLGVFGSEASTGKSAASDLVEGKRTLLVAETLARLPGPDRDRFEATLGDPELSEDDATWLRRAMQVSGGLAATEVTVDRLVADARAAIDELAIPAAARADLAAVAAAVGDRVS